MEQYLSAIVVLLCFLRALKFIKIMTSVGPTTQAILSVNYYFFVLIV